MRIPPVSSSRPIAYRLSAGTTTTPFQMCVLNSMSRFHLAAEAIRRVPRLSDRAPEPIADCEARIEQSVAHAHEHLEDPPRDP
jgi:xylulose-5-phosphate/fructose-6-phosphate phosphoketolase